eukprot:scaffold21860_cov54-Cyclotella_meneghiniana.AAC.3
MTFHRLKFAPIDNCFVPPSPNIEDSIVPLRESVPHDNTNTIQKAQTTRPPNDSNYAATSESRSTTKAFTEAASRQSMFRHEQCDDDGQMRSRRVGPDESCVCGVRRQDTIRKKIESRIKVSYNILLLCGTAVYGSSNDFM